MEHLPLEELLSARLVDPRRHLDAERVRRFARVLDELPPVTVFRLADETLLLTDGYHRVAAAQQAGRTTIRADVRAGTTTDALRFAVELAVRERGTSSEEARASIQRHSGGRWQPAPQSCGDRHGPAEDR